MTSHAHLIKTAQLYAPEDLGAAQLLVVAGKLLSVGPDLSAAARALNATVTALPGKIIPGLIDQHMHFLGGGDGDGPLARMPELSFGAIASAGITTAVGLLGSEIEAKTLPLLLRKANELAHAGLTTFIYTGAMALPAPHITASVRSDIALIDRIIGAKTALAERMYPNLDFSALANLAGELVQARAMTGKASVLHAHVGRLQAGLATLFDLIECIDLPIDRVVPTHINRSSEITPLFEHGLRFARQGGAIDFTCCLGPLDGLPSGIDVVEAVRRALDADIRLDQITLSGDAGVSVPDGAGGLRAVPPSILFRDIRRLVHQAGLGWPDALKPATTNVARVLGLAASKGRIAAGMDADLVFLDADDRITHVMAGGRFVHQPVTR